MWGFSRKLLRPIFYNPQDLKKALRRKLCKCTKKTLSGVDFASFQKRLSGVDFTRLQKRLYRVDFANCLHPLGIYSRGMLTKKLGVYSPLGGSAQNSVYIRFGLVRLGLGLGGLGQICVRFGSD